MKFSIIMPCYNGLNFTMQALESIQRCFTDSTGQHNSRTHLAEIIVINDASIDGTLEYLTEYVKQNSNTRLIHFEKNQGVPAGLNAGMKVATGEYIVWVNNDILLSVGCLDRMVKTLSEAELNSELTRIGAVAPMMNFVAGSQAITDSSYTVENLDKYAKDFAQDVVIPWEYTGWLCGSCLLLVRKLVDEVGSVDERFSPGGYEDTDYLLRAQLLGWKLIIDKSAFVHHYGSKTFGLQEFDDVKWGIKNFDIFIDKYADPEPKKLFAVYRVKNCADDLRKSLISTSKFADGIIVWCDNCTDDTPAVAGECEKVVRIIQSDLPFNEKRDRNAVISIAKEYNPDWIIVIDCDEELDENFTREKAQELMHPPNPMTLAYGFTFRNFWLGDTHFRTDGIIGNMRGPRMFRNLPEQYIVGGTSIGLHCTSIPAIPPQNIAWTSLCYKHHGFKTEEANQQKFEFYQNLDTEKRTDLIGQEDYSHIIANEVAITKYRSDNTISFYCLAKDNPAQLMQLLTTVWASVDEIIVINTSGDESITSAAEKFHAKTVQYNGKLDFAKMRNIGKKNCSEKWILTLDPDEAVDHEFITGLRTMIDSDCDGWLFDVNNYQKDGTYTHSETIRLFRNIPEFKYQGLVHENFDIRVEKHRLKIYKPPHIIHHYGYLEDSKDIAEKLERYKKLNLAQLEKYPNDPKAHFNIALHYINENQIDKAGYHLRKAADIDEKYPHPRIQLAMLHLMGAQEQLVEVVELLPTTHRIHGTFTQMLAWLNQQIGENPLIIE